MAYNYETDNGAILPPNFIPYIRYFPNPVQNDNTTDLGVDSIDAMDYDYELDTYDTDFPGEKYLLEYVVYDANPVQSDSTTDVKISSSVDAAAASLQLGTNDEETQAIEISSTEVTTTIDGPVTMINILNASSIELTSNLNVSGQTTLMNVSTQALTATSLEVTGTTTLSGNVNIGSTTSNGTMTTINGGSIKQIVPVLGGGTVETVIGNATNVTSMSTTFNKKRTEVGASGALDAIDCYTISNAPQTFTSQYFEIIICGSNLFYGGYSYKGCFSLYNPNNVPTPYSVDTLYSANGIPTVTLTVVGTTTTLSVRTNFGGSRNQNFMTTLIGYPTLIDNDGLFDFAITAI